MVSTRRSHGDKSQAYNAGDKVEILRPQGVIFGTLLYKSTDATTGRDSPSRLSSRWIVSVEGSPEEEVISEKQLGRVVATGEKPTIMMNNYTTTTSSSNPKNPKHGTKAKDVADTSPSHQNGAGTSSSSRSSSSSGGTSSSLSQKKKVLLSKGSSSSKKSLKKVPTKVVKKVATTAHHYQAKQTNQRAARRAIGTRASARRQGNDVLLQNGIETTRRPHPKSSRRSNSNKKSDETVVKVKMLTGTLFLYRGLNPRAEFVRVR